MLVPNLIALGVALIATATASASMTPPQSINARLMQMPAVSKTHIAFVYAGDIWVAPRSGGAAFRLSSPRGTEQFPRFSPDGQWLAFTGNYEGNDDIYVIPVTGGEPRRVTHHGARDRMVGWYPDGQHILFASTQESFTSRANQLFKVPVVGGVPEKLPVPYGEFGAISPDGKKLAYTPITTDFATWKRYRGGMASDIWLFDLETKAAEKVAPHEGIDSQPMWHGNTIYFISDRDTRQRQNIWAYDTSAKTVRQVTHFTDHDINFPSIGPDAIVFEQAGRLWLLELPEEKVHEVNITVVTDQTTLRPRTERVGNAIRNGSISPSGKRVVFEARGEIFSVPVEHGIVRNLTESSGVAERYPAWSPNGNWIAYFSDRSGEYELTIRPSDGKGEEKQLTNLGPGYRYSPHWSPDSKKIVFIDSAMKVHLHDIESRKTTVIDQQKWLYHGELERFRVSWSSDSRWIAYSGDTEADQSAVILYDTREGKRHQVTSGFYHDTEPTFDPAGKFLYYITRRWFDPIYSDFDRTWVYANAQSIVAVPLRKDIPSPLAPRNDEEPIKDDSKRPPAPKPAEPAPAPKPAAPKSGDEKPDPKKSGEKVEEVALKEQKPEDKAAAEKKVAEQQVQKPERKPGSVEIDLDGFEARGVILPPGARQIRNLSAIPGRIFFHVYPRKGSNSGNRPLWLYDLERREERMVMDDVSGYDLSADNRKLLIVRGGAWGVVNSAENQSFKAMNTSSLEATIDPREEWRQIFTDAWRIERDFFYDPHLHLVNWQQMRERYGAMLEDAVTRSDLNFIVGEMLGELNVSHAYRGGGDLDGGPGRSVGYLGCDFALEQGAHRIKRILETAPWDFHLRSPLREPGVNVKEGDWLLAVNGRRLDPAKDPWAAFQGMGGETVILTVNGKPTLDGAREVLVKTLSSESTLRRYAWIEANRRYVEEKSHGQIGYIYVPSTAVEGQNELYRQFRPQFTKPGLIIDERWNSGGQIPERFIELLSRRTLNYWGVRDGRDWHTPFMSHDGPKAMLINGWSGSGGDAFPWMFKKMNLGPLVGQRTWGGLIGMTGCPPLIDGGHVTVPTFGIYDTDGKWIIEGYGVDPDHEVVDDPAIMSQGIDPQLDRAIDEVMKGLKSHPPKPPQKPAYPNRAHPL